MEQDSKIIFDEQSGTGLFYCPGCECAHQFWTKGNGPRWDYNMNHKVPTVTPSIRISYGQNGKMCHFFIRSGNIDYCTDSTHHLSGQTVPLENFHQSINKTMATKKKAAKPAAPKKTAAPRKSSATKKVAAPVFSTDVDYNKDGDHWQPIAEIVAAKKSAHEKGKLVGYEWNSIVEPLVTLFDEGQRNETLFTQISKL